MSDFVAVTYRPSDYFRMELVESNHGCSVKIWSPRHAPSSSLEIVEIPVIRFVTQFIKEEHDDGVHTCVYIFEIEDQERFYEQAMDGSYEAASAISVI